MDDIVCQKCGGDKPWEVIYCGGRYSSQKQIGCSAEPEHLHKTCPICKYSFMAPTYDQEQRMDAGGKQVE